MMNSKPTQKHREKENKRLDEIEKIAEELSEKISQFNEMRSKRWSQGDIDRALYCESLEREIRMIRNDVKLIRNARLRDEEG